MNHVSTDEPSPEPIDTHPKIGVDLALPHGDVSRIQYSLCRKIHHHNAFEQSLGLVLDPSTESCTVELNLDDTPYVYFTNLADRPVVHWLDLNLRTAIPEPDGTHSRLENGGRSIVIEWSPTARDALRQAGLMAAVELKHERSATVNWAYFSMRMRGPMPEFTFQSPPTRPPLSETMQILPITVDFAEGDLQRPIYTNIFDYSKLPRGVDLDLALVVNQHLAPPFCFEFHITEPGVSFHPCGDDHDQVLVRFIDNQSGDALEQAPDNFHGCRLYDRRTCHVEWRPQENPEDDATKLWVSTFFLKALHARSGRDARIAPRVVHTG